MKGNSILREVGHNLGQCFINVFNNKENESYDSYEDIPEITDLIKKNDPDALSLDKIERSIEKANRDRKRKGILMTNRNSNNIEHKVKGKKENEMTKDSLEKIR